jgi:CubicO group peptidase (beta-lactamase class C family)
MNLTPLRNLGFGLLIVFAGTCAPAFADTGAAQDIDAAVERSMAAFTVPGVTVSVVRDGELVYARGHGVREIGQSDQVDDKTVFQIASVSKAFTAAALALLVDEGLLNWEDKVIDYLPDFRMFDPWVTREFTIRDMLTHRSGLPLGAGDLLFWPEAETTIDEVVRALRFLKPSSSFRSKYDYDNLMYIIAGEIVTRISGVDYADFVEARILQPLGMTGCRVGPSHARGLENRATPHVLVEGELQTTAYASSDFTAAAGGVICDAQGMGQWMKMWLSGGLKQDGEPLLSAEQIDQLWGPVTLKSTSKMMKEHAGSHMSAYALGWNVSSFYGEPVYSHGGAHWGMTTFIAVMPRQNLAVFVSNNQMGVAPRALVYHVLDHYLGGDKDWVGIYDEWLTAYYARAEEAVKTAAAEKRSDSNPNLPLEEYVGTYRDDWYGDIYIEQVDGKLFFRSRRTPRLRGPLEHFQSDTFIVRWTDRQLKADAYVSFLLAVDGGVERIAMKAVSPATDFSYDFHDLDLVKVDTP